MVGLQKLGLAISLACACCLSALPLAPPAAAQEDLRTEVRFTGHTGDVLTDTEKDLIRTIAVQTHAEVYALLPALGRDITIEVTAGPGVIPETGEVGASVAPGMVSWTINPDHALGVEAIVRSYLRETLFHEFHHQVRGWTLRGNPPGTTIMDAVIAEGMASVFARDFAGADVPWAADPDDPVAWLSDLRENGSMMQYNQWMFDHPDGRRWIGYRTGVWVVDRAIAASGETSASLAQVPTQEVLALIAGE